MGSMLLTGRPKAWWKTCQNATVFDTKFHTEKGQGMKTLLLDEKTATNRLSQVSGQLTSGPFYSGRSLSQYPLYRRLFRRYCWFGRFEAE